MRLVIIVLTFSTVAAADPPPRAVTLAEVVAAAGTGPASRASRHDVAAAEAAVDAAVAWPSPSVHVETNRLTAKLVAGTSLPVPIFGTIGAARRAATAQASAVRAEAIVIDRDVHRRAVTAWIALARADGGVVAAATAAKQAADLETIARGRLTAGEGADVDVTTAKAARARADLAVATAKREQQAAAAELAGIVGWDPLQPLVSAGDLPGREPITLEAIRARLPAHPERAVAERKVTAADAALAQTRAQGRPSLAVEAQVSAWDPTTPGTDVLLGLTLDVPLFAHTGDRMRSARATATAERARLAATVVELDANLVAAYRRWQSATETLAALETDIVPAQERAATLSALAYRDGARDLASALQADRDLAAVHAEVVAAHANVATAWVALETAAGEELHAR